MNWQSDYSLDTHSIIWYFEGHKALSKKAKEAIDLVFTDKTTASISVIVLLEAFHNSLKHPKFEFEKFRSTLIRPNIFIFPLGEDILDICTSLPKKLEIHDRVIAATSLITKSILISKDPQLKSLSNIKTLW